MQRKAAAAGHGLLYLLILAQPLQQSANVPHRLGEPQHVVRREDVGRKLPCRGEAAGAGAVQWEYGQRDVDAECGEGAGDASGA